MLNQVFVTFFMVNTDVLPLLPHEAIILSPSQATPNYSGFVFCTIFYLSGLLGIVFNRKNFLVTMLCAELMYLGVIGNFALYGTLAYDSSAQIYALLLLVLAACESAIGLGLLIALYRFGRTVDFKYYQQLGG